MTLTGKVISLDVEPTEWLLDMEAKIQEQKGFRRTSV
jgi:hypothetical protein